MSQLLKTPTKVTDTRETPAASEASLEACLGPLANHPALRAAREAAIAERNTAHGPVTISGLTPAAKAFVTAAVATELGATSRSQSLLVLTADNESADRLARAAATFLGWLGGSPDAVVTLPTFDCSPYEGRSPHAAILERRALALWNISRGRVRVLVAPLAAALGRFSDASYYRSLALELKPGDDVSLDDFAEHLTGIGYQASEPVSAPGLFSIRGGIVDIFPPEVDWPVRMEFFGDQIESLREFDPSTQRSRHGIPATTILPLSEIKQSPGLFQLLVARLAAREAHDGRHEPSWAPEYSVPFPGWEFFAPLAESRPNTLASLLSQAGEASVGSMAGSRSRVISAGGACPVVIWDEPLDRERELAGLLQGWAEAFDSVRDMTPPRPRPEDVFLREPEFWKLVEHANQIGLKELAIGGRQTPPAPDAAAGRETEPQASADEPGSAGVSPAVRCPKHLERAGETPALPGSPEASILGNAVSRFSSFAEVALMSQPAPRYHGSLKPWVEEVHRRIDGGETVVLALAASGKADRLHEIFHEYQIPFVDAAVRHKTPPSPPAPLPQGGEGRTEIEGGTVPRGGEGRTVFENRSGDGSSNGGSSDGGSSELKFPRRLPLLIVRGDLDECVSFPDLRILIESETEIFGSFAWGRPGQRDKSSVISSFITDLSDLKVGDYVVHVDHGIALYNGLRQIEVEGQKRDFMLLTYQDEAKLYVPLERLDLVEKYRSGGEGAKPTLDRLGGVTWEKTKARVKRALRDMAQELLRIYAQRKMSGGIACGPDTPWQKEFEEQFEFDETPDQLSALTQIKGDLESPEPMDRLLCGDVGYGKTELAMRAAFKVAQEGRQVAVLTPTTVLSFQHWNTFRQRMGSFPMRIEMLSRFRSAGEQKAVVADVEAGKVDIVIGTHRLLSKDVNFRDLGLLVVDEEQRFGVAAKEKLKKLRANVDVLTLTATPIPRTLHMSLGGLRDLSVIETPPRGRLAIQTVVAPFSDGLVQSAILQEMARQGQVYFVHNRVDSIFSMAALIQRLVPTARIGVGHGQMGEKELERVMLKFMEHQYDVFVSTSIIENGLDIPLANTLIVNHADHFGLAELYQLRGRVGRSDRRAYAYLLIPAEESLTPIARRRLAALKEFSDLGAGFRLAALDLELRGAGNLLGGEQSGHLNAIGLDLYLKMLEEAVEELRGNAPALTVHTTLNLGLDIKIPDAYIADESQRLRMYKRISSVASEADRADMGAELVDRYGELPAPVKTLLQYAIVKAAAEQILIQSIERKGEEMWIRFHTQSPVDPERLRQFMRRHREAVLRPDGTFRFRLRAQDERLLTELHATLQELRASN
ncbi:MAG TPA: transcription-repair coupling factor [Terriglobia bacterium]|nr:transcription-repair coupling factor [Terriglobia bacterium]